ncbi:MAG: hypothetical protein AAF419_03055, partial [Pseudomonadota bacterium]
DYRDILCELDTPTLMLFGEHDALIRSATKDNINNCFIETHVLESCGHAPFVNRSAEIIGTVTKFSKRYGIQI